MLERYRVDAHIAGRENVQHKNSIKVLRDEITSLKEELLEVKHANRILAGRVDASRRAAPSAQASVIMTEETQDRLTWIGWIGRSRYAVGGFACPSESEKPA